MIPLHDDNPTATPPLLTVVLIVVCVLVFFWQLSLGPQQARIVYALGVIPAVLFGHLQLPEAIALVMPPATVFSSMFLHGGWMHLIGNMLYLWIFGNNIEDAMGHARVLVAIPFGFYLHTMRIKAGWVLGFWFVMQLISSAANAGQQGGVAFGAHIGGFVAGMLLLPLFKRRDVRYFHLGRFDG